MLFGLMRASVACLVAVLFTAGCASTPEPEALLRERNQADVVVGFQSWRSIWFIKPDVTGAAGSMRLRQKTFTRDGFVKLLNNLKVGRELVVVVLDRRYEPDPYIVNGGANAIQKFFEDLGFRRVVFQE